MKNVHASNSDHLPDVAKFHFDDKVFIPHQVDGAELHITTTNGTEIKEFPKASLSFYLGKQHPFTKISMNSEDEGNYIVLPWNLGNRVGRDNLKNLNERLERGNIKELKYIICINDNNSQSNLNSLESSKDLSQSLTSLASLHLSDIVAEDETESLLNKIGDLEQRLRERDNVINQKQAQISSLTTQVNSLNTQVYSMSSQVSSLNTQVDSKTSEFNNMKSQVNSLTTQVNNLQASNNSYSNQINQFNSNKNGYYLENDQGGRKTYRLTNYTGSLRANAGIDFSNCSIIVTGNSELRTTLDIQFTPS
ncbi:hypothetical protein [Candidatus Tisiphia endosymbiont of Nemotelus uliginosus]